MWHECGSGIIEWRLWRGRLNLRADQRETGQAGCKTTIIDHMVSNEKGHPEGCPFA
jgi:hypothetical protein